MFARLVYKEGKARYTSARKQWEQSVDTLAYYTKTDNKLPLVRVLSHKRC